MKKLHFTVDIDASPHTVWSTMLGAATYREWTRAFNSDSHVEGTWEVGSTMRFLGLDSNGSVGGMVATVIDNRPGEFVSLEYVGQITDDADDTTSDFAVSIAGTHEVYSFTATESGTRLTVNADSLDEFAPMFTEQWPLALNQLKQIAERTV
ncbi:hypothetical protein JF66_01320 [Cryobacterium sp. MLB-32]|uniref:SRPBCC family protein n=1 Tax=Cryobacterium sp. MLB-32 TaxID=1529318 RepID=UPI0004E7755D|nr:SRPBCC domain-containing protein [Cryobacterium sp. MLB-32]KFF60915.1 hypothetical protein JF66_01320 [Cryobacterium sp. MLB-32]